MTIAEATRQLKAKGYHVETDEGTTYLYVRKSVNSFPTKLRISEAGTVSDRSIRMLLK